jgi:ribA/ribD-fused uncharacterized protein
MPYGTNVIFCINSFNGYNQDDGILFNRSSIERGLFRSLALRSYSTAEEQDPISKALYRVGNPKFVLSWTDLKPGNDYTQLDEFGVIREGVKIHDKTVLVGRYMTNPDTGKITDASLLPTVFTKGTVDKVVVLHMGNGMRMIHVRILEERVPELGDKFSSRHGQKGTMGMLLDAQDMPRTADGLVPDVVVNPHCIPSRMTIAQLLEQVFGKYGAIIGAKMNATTFMNNEDSYNAIAEALESMGLQRNGEEILYSGMTGKMFSTSVFMGPLYFMRLKHLTQDKVNSRGLGRKEIRTHQPTGGRGNEGGMRVGEMERDSLLAHGGAAFLRESMMKRSDGTSFYICNGCGTIPIYNEAHSMFVCPMCDGPLTFQGETADTMSLVLPVRKSRATFSRVEMPYAMKLLDQELTTFMNAGLRFVTEKTARRFREPTELGYIQEAQEEDNKEEEQVAKAIDESAAAMSAPPPAPVPMDDAGAEEAPADIEDEGAPARNEMAPQEIPPGAAVLDFSTHTPQYKEFLNYYPVKLLLEGKEWPTVEHYFQAMKFPSNPEYQETIRKTKTPAAAKRMGKTRDVAIRPDWSSFRLTVMETAIREKFSERHDDLRRKLLETGDAILRQDSPQDNFWGIGRSKKGQNELGKILMKIRGEIRAAAAPVAVPQAAETVAAPPAEEEVARALETRADIAAGEAARAAEAEAAQQPQEPAAQQPTPAPEPVQAPQQQQQQQQPPTLEITEVSANELPQAGGAVPQELQEPQQPQQPQQTQETENTDTTEHKTLVLSAPINLPKNK